VIVKRAVREKIKMEPRLREVDKGRAAKITKHLKLAPSASSETRFHSAEAGPFGKLIGRFSLSRQ